MSSDDTTHFQLNVNGISLELSGEREFVQQMYQQIMRDLEVARDRMIARQSELIADDRSATAVKRRIKARKTPIPEQDNQVIWLHRCNDMVHKIYMASADDIRASPLFGLLDPSAIGTLYVRDPLLARALPRFERGQTLWAELTAAGRRKIAEATGAYKEGQ